MANKLVRKTKTIAPGKLEVRKTKTIPRRKLEVAKTIARLEQTLEIGLHVHLAGTFRIS